jgi:hypothetical protein
MRNCRTLSANARLASLCCSPRLYGGTERVVSFLTEELVRQGHDVTLFASGETSAKLVRCCEMAPLRAGRFALPHDHARRRSPEDRSVRCSTGGGHCRSNRDNAAWPIGAVSAAGRIGGLDRQRCLRPIRAPLRRRTDGLTAIWRFTGSFSLRETHTRTSARSAGRVKDGGRCDRLNSASLYKRSTIRPHRAAAAPGAFDVRGRSASGTDCRIARCC